MGATLGVLALIGTGISAAGQIYSGIRMSQQYEYNQAVAEYEADYARKRAAVEETQFRKEIKSILGRQRAISGASGGEVNTGSNLAVLAGTAGELEIDAAMIRYGGELDAWRAQTQADLFGSQAGSALVGGFLGAGSTLLTGASVYDKYFGSAKKTSQLVESRRGRV